MDFSDTTLPHNSKFGFFFAAVFTLIGIYLFRDESVTVSYVLFLLAILFFVITLINADTLLPLNRLWMRFGLVLGMVISPLVLGIIFFCLFMPISILMKLFGRDELRLKLVGRTSHWKERNTDASQDDAFRYQF